MKQHPNLGQQFTLLGIPVVVQQNPDAQESEECVKCAFHHKNSGSRYSCFQCDDDHDVLPRCFEHMGAYYERVNDVDPV